MNGSKNLNSPRITCFESFRKVVEALEELNLEEGSITLQGRIVFRPYEASFLAGIKSDLSTYPCAVIDDGSVWPYPTIREYLLSIAMQGETLEQVIQRQLVEVPSIQAVNDARRLTSALTHAKYVRAYWRKYSIVASEDETTEGIRLSIATKSDGGWYVTEEEEDFKEMLECPLEDLEWTALPDEEEVPLVPTTTQTQRENMTTTTITNVFKEYIGEIEITSVPENKKIAVLSVVSGVPVVLDIGLAPGRYHISYCPPLVDQNGIGMCVPEAEWFYIDDPCYPHYPDEVTAIIRNSTNIEAAEWIAAKFVDAEDGWAHWCTTCVSIHHRRAIFGNLRLFVNSCRLHGGRQDCIDQVRNALPADLKSRADGLGSYIYDFVM